MTQFSRRIRGSAACAAFCLALVGASLATADDNEPVVPPGQDNLLAAMLGRGLQLPDGCAFGNGVADGAVVRVSYVCPYGEVVFALVHPTSPWATEVQTDRFALTLQSGAASDALVASLMSLIRAREGAFQWIALGDEAAAGVSRSDTAE
jgi:hypothetical protein